MPLIYHIPLMCPYYTICDLCATNIPYTTYVPLIYHMPLNMPLIYHIYATKYVVPIIPGCTLGYANPVAFQAIIQYNSNIILDIQLLRVAPCFMLYMNYFNQIT